ncbi:hypothetical protein EJ08DRAFT_644895 [Tothia fuscella]|uniref:Uncharacterized protein n=1 Tax=Tothia fuscella TaxID=1048955 RepID=A0A9P4U376_9PEZI|nr:hypothetical protein EJ08DRAFT_644895 [Tothia fuscella]
MRLLPIIPAIFCVGALILSFLCLFAGSKPGFMEDYSVLNLNTSRIGQNLLNTSSSSSSSNPLSTLFHNITDPLVNDIKSDLNNWATSLAKDLGLKDFYSAHLMDYCEGSYTPGPVPNVTLSKSKIERNVTYCSNRTAMFAFDPKASLQKSLNETGLGVTLDQLNWPKALDDGIRALRTAFKAAFVLYCMGVGFIFVTLVACLFWTSACSDGGRGTALLEIILASLAFITLGIASAVMTAIGVKGNTIIDKYGKSIGVSADRGNGFMGLTWAATGLMVLAAILGCVGCCMKRNRHKVKRVGEKP